MMSQPFVQLSLKQEHVNQTNDPNPHAELFSVIHAENPISSWDNRNLPKSFFRSPIHSRNSSIDSSSSQQPQRQISALPIHHSRTISAPLPRSGNAACSLLPQHGRQGSDQASQPISLPASQFYPAGAGKPMVGAGLKPVAVPTPIAEWQQSHQQQQKQQQEATTIVVDMNTLVQHGHPALNPAGIPQPFGAILQVLGPLPANWVPAVTAEYEIYFINHNDRNTHWFPPHILSDVSKCGPLKIFRPQLPSQQSPQQQMSPASSQLSLAVAKTSAAATVVHQQQQSPPHIVTTGVTVSAINGGLLTQSPRGDQQQIMLELQRLQLERERLHYHQEMILAKEVELKRVLGGAGVVGVAPTALHGGGGVMLGHGQGGQGGAMTAATMVSASHVSTNSMDPFLGRTALAHESHARQNSADSGLGGMGAGGYSSLPRTPEDYLANVDEMDGTDAILRRQHQQQQLLGIGDFGEMGSMEIVDYIPVDSDELVPSLQDVPELMDGLNQWL